MTTVAGIHQGLDIHANRPAATAVTAGTLYSCSDHSLIYISDGSAWSTYATLGGAGGGGDVPGWVSYLAARQSGETSHADDDFFDDASKAGTELTVAGTATWTEKYGLLSVVANGQTGSDLAAYLEALTASGPPVTVETAIRKNPAAFATDGSEFEFVAVGFSDGTVAGSNYASLSILDFGSGSQMRLQAGAHNDSTLVTGTNRTFIASHKAFGPLLYMRCIWSAANTFKGQISIDGVTWTTYGFGSASRTMTPSHLGFYVMSDDTDAGEDTLAAFEYRRVYEADLSL